MNSPGKDNHQLYGLCAGKVKFSSAAFMAVQEIERTTVTTFYEINQIIITNFISII